MMVVVVVMEMVAMVLMTMEEVAMVLVMAVEHA